MKIYRAIFIIFSLIVIASSQLENDIKLQKKIHECFAETKVPIEVQKRSATSLLGDPKFKCFNACLMKKKGTMRDGRIDPEKQLSTMHPDSFEMIKDIVNTCSTTANQEFDECEVAHTYVKCLIKNVSIYRGLK